MVKIKALPVKKIFEALQSVGGVLHAPQTSEVSFLNGLQIESIAEPAQADSKSISFLISESFLKDAANTQANVLVVQKALLPKLTLSSSVKVCIAADDAYVGLALVSHLIKETDPLFFDWQQNEAEAAFPAEEDIKIHPRASVHSTVKLGSGTVVMAGAVIGPYVKMGKNCVVFPNTVIYPRTEIADRVRIHANAVIGSDGFGYAKSPRGALKIWHLGKVVIGSDVEIGAGTAIDRGTIKDTIIEPGAKLDNLIQIGHNGHIGAHSILCAQVGLAGNVTVGKGAILAGKAGVADKITIGDGAVVGPLTGISKDVPSGEVYMGAHMARKRKEWWKLLAFFDRLPEIHERLKKLEKEHEKELQK